MASNDGNGWVRCRCGEQHWGRFGAAGLLLLRAGETPRVLLQLRAPWTHQGGSWGLVGGARDSHELPVEAALREAAEEAGVDPDAVRVLASVIGLDHGDWSYTYVVALARWDLLVRPITAESDQVSWIALEEVPDLPLHTGLGTAWTGLHPLITGALASTPE
jgi:8-oxo-dGTP diphosphatase